MGMVMGWVARMYTKTYRMKQRWFSERLLQTITRKNRKQNFPHEYEKRIEGKLCRIPAGRRFARFHVRLFSLVWCTNGRYDAPEKPSFKTKYKVKFSSIQCCWNFEFIRLTVLVLMVYGKLCTCNYSRLLLLSRCRFICHGWWLNSRPQRFMWILKSIQGCSIISKPCGLDGSALRNFQFPKAFSVQHTSIIHIPRICFTYFFIDFRLCPTCKETKNSIAIISCIAVDVAGVFIVLVASNTYVKYMHEILCNILIYTKYFKRTWFPHWFCVCVTAAGFYLRFDIDSMCFFPFLSTWINYNLRLWILSKHIYDVWTCACVWFMEFYFPHIV